MNTIIDPCIEIGIIKIKNNSNKQIGKMYPIFLLFFILFLYSYHKYTFKQLSKNNS